MLKPASLDLFLQCDAPHSSFHNETFKSSSSWKHHCVRFTPWSLFCTLFHRQTSVWILEDYYLIIPGLHRNYSEQVCSHMHEHLKITAFVGWFTTHMPLLPPFFTITDPHKPVASTSAWNPSWSDFGPVACSSENHSHLGSALLLSTSNLVTVWSEPNWHVLWNAIWLGEELCPPLVVCLSDTLLFLHAWLTTISLPSHTESYGVWKQPH